jgi:hypothetical protein
MTFRIAFCEQLKLPDTNPFVKIYDQENDVDLARTRIYEHTHALLHFDVDDDTSRSKHEVKAVAYVVGHYCGIDMSDSTFYLAAWGVGRSGSRSQPARPNQSNGQRAHRHPRRRIPVLTQLTNVGVISSALLVKFSAPAEGRRRISASVEL